MSETDFEASVPSEDEAVQEPKLVPVSESIRYRKRAQNAEKQLAILEHDLEKKKTENQQLAENLDQAENEQKLMTRLASAGVIDLDAAVLIAKAKMEKEETADVSSVIEKLREEKGYLFFPSGNELVPTLTAGAKERMPSGKNVLERAARKAAKTGLRADLQEYLKLRRNII